MRKRALNSISRHVLAGSISAIALQTCIAQAQPDELKTADFQIPASGDKTVQIVDSKPARLQSKRVALDTTDRVFAVINRFRDQPGTRFKGVRVEIGEGENTVTVRFQEREVTAAIIEGVVNSLRDVLGEPEALINIAIADGVQFDTGFALKEFAKLAGIELKPGEVSQED